MITDDGSQGDLISLLTFKVLLEEKLCENAERVGKVLLEELNKIPKSQVTTVRGRGLMCAIVINDRMYLKKSLCLLIHANCLFVEKK